MQSHTTYLRRCILISLLTMVTLISNAMIIDTVDYWVVKVNGKKAAEVGEVLKLSKFNDSDSLEMFFKTDHGAHRVKWHLVIKDSYGQLIDTFANSIDSIYDPKNLYFRKNSIAFRIGELRRVFSSRAIDRIFIQFEFAFPGEQNTFQNVNILILSRD